MTNILKSTLAALEKASFFIGEVISTVVLTVFYFSVFLLFALPVRFFNDYLGLKNLGSSWIAKTKSPSGIKDFEKE